MLKHFIAALKAAFIKWQIERLDKAIEAATRARASAKQRALKAQAKRDELLKN